MIVRFTADAKSDLFAAMRYYDEECAGLGDRFWNAVYSGARLIERTPESWPYLEDPARIFIVDGFPYALVYFVESDVVAVVVAVFELHQSPENLKRRLK